MTQYDHLTAQSHAHLTFRGLSLTQAPPFGYTLKLVRSRMVYLSNKKFTLILNHVFPTISHSLPFFPSPPPPLPSLMLLFPIHKFSSLFGICILESFVPLPTRSFLSYLVPHPCHPFVYHNSKASYSVAFSQHWDRKKTYRSSCNECTYDFLCFDIHGHFKRKIKQYWRSVCDKFLSSNSVKHLQLSDSTIILFLINTLSFHRGFQIIPPPPPTTAPPTPLPFTISLWSGLLVHGDNK